VFKSILKDGSDFNSFFCTKRWLSAFIRACKLYERRC